MIVRSTILCRRTDPESSKYSEVAEDDHDVEEHSYEDIHLGYWDYRYEGNYFAGWLVLSRYQKVAAVSHPKEVNWKYNKAPFFQNVFSFVKIFLKKRITFTGSLEKFFSFTLKNFTSLTYFEIYQLNLLRSIYE